MKKLAIIFLFLLLPLHTLAIDSLPPKPVPARFYNEFTPTAITQQQGAYLNSKLESYYKATTNQVAIAVVKTTEPYEIAEYSFELGRKWGVGEKDKNNGIMIVWATEDKEIFIATGYGMEGQLTDAMTKRIIESYIIPSFKNGQFFEGLDNGTNAIIKVISGELKLPASQPQRGSSFVDQWNRASTPEKIFMVIVIIIFIFMRLNGFGGRVTFGGGRSYSSGGSSFGGGSFGGGGAGGRY